MILPYDDVVNVVLTLKYNLVSYTKKCREPIYIWIIRPCEFNYVNKISWFCSYYYWQLVCHQLINSCLYEIKSFWVFYICLFVCLFVDFLTFLNNYFAFIMIFNMHSNWKPGRVSIGIDTWPIFCEVETQQNKFSKNQIHKNKNTVISNLLCTTHF
jgi:hypothetical protein